MDTLISISDDSGFLGIIDPAKYQGFVAEDWTFGSIQQHFIDQMHNGSILFWATGMEGNWRMRVTTSLIPNNEPSSFRTIDGQIVVTDHHLLVVNYETLAMAAQFKDICLPEPHLAYCRFEIPNGRYQCRVAQKHDPDDRSIDPTLVSDWDFQLQLVPTTDLRVSWRTIPWHDG